MDHRVQSEDSWSTVSSSQQARIRSEDEAIVKDDNQWSSDGLIRDSATPYRGGKMTTQNSLDDFDESEWTPPDSSYGAAIPVAGWIPKHIRQLIEGTLISIGVLGVALLIVATSIRWTDGIGSTSNSVEVTDNATTVGDDEYVAYESSYRDNGDDDGNGDDGAVADDDNAYSDDGANDDFMDDVYVVADDDDGDGGYGYYAAEYNDDYFNNYYGN